MYERFLLTLSMVFLTIFLLLAACAKLEAAQLSGKAYLYYAYDDSRGAQGANGFDISRVYITLREELAPSLKVRVTSDVSRSGGKLTPYIKYAYFTYSGFLPGISLSAGQVATPWVGFEDKLWGYHWVAKNYLDHAGILSSADYGALLSAKRGGFDCQLGVVNGEGYKSSEVNKYKDVQGRLTYSPVKDGALSGLKLSAFGSYGYIEQEAERSRLAATASYQGELLTLGAQGFVTTDQVLPGGDKNRGEGGSAFYRLSLSKGWHLFGRGGGFDSPLTDKEVRVISGISREMADKFRLALDNQQVINKEPSESIENVYYLHCELKY